ncbi:TPA: LysR family transcriptional regulator, partial [Pseudomonas aeruginosa]
MEVITHYFSTLPKQMAGTERIVTMRRRLAELYVQHYPLRIIPAPIPLSLIQEHMVRLVREEIIKTVGVEARRE